MLRLYIIRDRQNRNKPVEGKHGILYASLKSIAKETRDAFNKKFPMDNLLLHAPPHTRFYISPGPDHRKWRGDKL